MYGNFRSAGNAFATLSPHTTGHGTMSTVIGILVFLAGSVGSVCSLTSIPHYRDYFYVGGEYVPGPTGETVRNNQMYVEKLSPLTKFVEKEKPPYPLVFIHGKGMTGTNWLNTPDGRQGWASYFVSQGFPVYIVDQPARARSPWLPGDFSMQTYSAEAISQHFTATQDYNLWPQSTKLTQWPGSGLKGDATFDAFYASTIQFLSNDTEAQIKSKAAGAALLDKIGPAILITHSQSGLYGWPIADARPKLVKAIVAVEPAGPPFHEQLFFETPARLWGLTDIPLTYDPPASSPDEIKTVTIPYNGTDRVSCILQQEPARRLPNLMSIPVLIEVGEASFHAMYDHCTVAYLRQAQVKADFLRLEEVGVKGNGHMQMMEKNNLQIARLLHNWIRENVH